MAVWPNGSSSIPTVTSEFSPARRNPVSGVVESHNGIDLIGWSTVVAPASGQIIFAGYNGGAGNEVRIRADNGDVYRLLHNSRFLRTGGRVSEGEGVAIMGTTGQSTGVHCHFETHPGGLWNAINPREYMARNGGGGSADVGAGQRTANAVVNRRREATSASAIAGEPLQPGDVGNFVGWKRGESVEGNNVWYQGISGDWFWSGGFHEGANGTGLKDLNPVAVSGNQRIVGGDIVNRRIGDASSSAPAGEPLQPGDVGNFTHWKRGESVEGNNVWFKGTSGDYFWSGGFVGGANTAGLPEEVLSAQAPAPAPAPAGSTQRKVLGSDSVNGRTDHNTGAPIVQILAPGTVGDFKAYAEGQAVEGNNIWFQGAYAGNWFWSGAFEGGANTAGLPRADGGATPPAPAPAPAATPSNRDNPRGLKEYKPIYSRAVIGLEAPLGFNADGSRASRKTKGTNPPVATTGVLDRFIIHWTGVVLDQLSYFSYNNDRSSCPNLFLRPDGKVYEMIRPGAKSAATGADWNWRSLSVEAQMVAGNPPITDAELEELAWIAAEIYSYNGKTWDGTPVSFELDRTHIIGHRDANTTECPGDYLYGKIDSIIARAKVIYAEHYSDTKPVDPKPSDPSAPGDTVAVDRSWLRSVWEKLGKLLGK